METPSVTVLALGFACSALMSLACADPEALQLELARVNGRQIYLENCAPCHGERADGKGPQSGPLDPKPRNHSDPAWRAATDYEQVHAAIHSGVAGSAMPAWGMLSEADLDDLTTYVLSVAELGPWVGDEEPREETQN